MSEKRRYILDGARFSTLEGFLEEISHLLIPDESWIVRGLNGFNDILRGGFGTPEEGFVIYWKNSNLSRQNLGYEETARQLRQGLEKCHAADRDGVAASLRDAENHTGPTVFDWLVEIIQDHGPGGDESEDGVELELK